MSAGFGFDVLVVGEALTDIVISDETYVEHVGGSPANVALGLGRCGMKSAFLTQIGNDSRGRAIAAHLRASGVDVLTESFTARKTSTAIARIAADGQATYAFNVEWNTLSPIEPVKARVVHTGSIATFLEPGGASVRQLLRQTRAESITFDPNIRPVFLPDHGRALSTFEEMARLCTLLKMSDEDAAWLYPNRSLDAIVDIVLGWGPA